MGDLLVILLPMPIFPSPYAELWQRDAEDARVLGKEAEDAFKLRLQREVEEQQIIVEERDLILSVFAQ